METVQARLSNATELGKLPAGSAFQTVEADFPEVPALIYDGPFSDHLSGRTPKMLEGLPQVSEAEARRAAAAFLGLLQTARHSLHGKAENSLAVHRDRCGIAGRRAARADRFTAPCA